MEHFTDTEYLESLIFDEVEDDEEIEAKSSQREAEEAEEIEEMIEQETVRLDLTLEDGSSMACKIAGVFLEQEKEYVALETDEGMIYIMGLSQGEEDEIKLLPLESEEEQEAALDAFFRMVEEEREAYSETEFPGFQDDEEAEVDREEIERGMEDDRDQNREED